MKIQNTRSQDEARQKTHDSTNHHQTNERVAVWPEDAQQSWRVVPRIL